jgi:hypothetical protein
MRLYGHQKNVSYRYILCTLILSNPFHLIIGSRLILIQNELRIPKCCHANSKFFSYVYNSHKMSLKFQLIVYHDTCYTSLFLGEKWFILKVKAHWGGRGVAKLLSHYTFFRCPMFEIQPCHYYKGFSQCFCILW